MTLVRTPDSSLSAMRPLVSIAISWVLASLARTAEKPPPRPGHGPGFLDGPHGHLGIDRCRDRRRQLDALSSHRVEARQGKGHRVDARPQIDDFIEALAVGDNGADLFYQSRTGRFDRDA